MSLWNLGRAPTWFLSKFVTIFSGGQLRYGILHIPCKSCTALPKSVCNFYLKVECKMYRNMTWKEEKLLSPLYSRISLFFTLSSCLVTTLTKIPHPCSTRIWELHVWQRKTLEDLCIDTNFFSSIAQKSASFQITHKFLALTKCALTGLSCFCCFLVHFVFPDSIIMNPWNVCLFRADERLVGVTGGCWQCSL